MDAQQIMQEDEIDLRKYIEIIIERRKIILSLFFISVFAAAISSYLAPKVYKATASIDIAPAHEALLTSNEVLQRIIQKLHLTQAPEDLLQKLSIKKTTGTNEVQLFVFDAQPQAAKDMANIWAQECVSYLHEQILGEIKGNGNFLVSQFEIARKNFLQAEEKVNGFNKETKLDLMKAELAKKKGMLISYKNELADAALSLKTKEDSLGEFKKQIATQEKFIVVSKAITDDALWQSADAQANRSAINKSSLKSENINPIYQSLEARVVNTEIEINTIKSRTEYLSKAVESLIKENKELENDIIQKESDLAQLTREVDISKKFYNDLSAKVDENRLVKVAQFGDVQVVSPAITPRSPEGQGKTKIVVLAGILSLMLGMFLAFFMEFWQEGKREAAKK